MADGTPQSDPKMGATTARGLRELKWLCLGPYPPGHESRKQSISVTDREAGVPLTETLPKLASFDEAEAQKHTLHALSIHHSGRPDVLEPTRYQEYQDLIDLLEKRYQFSISGGQVPGYAGCPSQAGAAPPMPASQAPAKATDEVVAVTQAFISAFPEKHVSAPLSLTMPTLLPQATQAVTLPHSDL